MEFHQEVDLFFSYCSRTSISLQKVFPENRERKVIEFPSHQGGAATVMITSNNRFIPYCFPTSLYWFGLLICRNTSPHELWFKTQYLHHTCACNGSILAPSDMHRQLLTVTHANMGTCTTDWRFSSYSRRTEWACASSQSPKSQKDLQ